MTVALRQEIVPDCIIFHNVEDEYIESVIEEAGRCGLLKNLQRCFEQLAGWHSKEKGRRVVVGKDFAPFSFVYSYQIERDLEWDTFMHGGMLYHGPHDGGGDGSAPTYSVCIDPSHGWRLHS